MRYQDELRKRSLAPTRLSSERPAFDATRPTRAAVVQAVSTQVRAQARGAAGAQGLKR